MQGNTLGLPKWDFQNCMRDVEIQRKFSTVNKAERFSVDQGSQFQI